MRITEVRHFGVAVTDLHKAVNDFLEMGFTIFEKGICGKDFSKKITGKDTTIDYVKLQSPIDCTMIELLKFTPDIGVPFHIALTVSDIGWFDVKEPAVDRSGKQIKYVNRCGIIFEVVQ